MSSIPLILLKPLLVTGLFWHVYYGKVYVQLSICTRKTYFVSCSRSASSRMFHAQYHTLSNEYLLKSGHVFEVQWSP